MTRRECQSCRFFQAAGFDNMGWCTHPKRRIGADVRIYVRGQELPCRNDWANDLWQLADQYDTDIVIDAAAAPVRPATPEELSILAEIDKRAKPDTTAADAAARGEDVVVGEVTASIAAGEMSQPSPPRQSFRRAHEELKTRNKETRPGVAPVVDDAGLPVQSAEQAWPVLNRLDAQPDAAEPALRRERPVVHSTMPNGQVSPVSLGEIGRPFPKMTTFPEDDDRFSSIPQVDETFDLPIVSQSSTPRIVGRAGFDDDHVGVAAWSHPEPAATEQSLDDDAPVFDEVPQLSAERAAYDDAPIEHAPAPAPRRRLLGRSRPRPVRQQILPAEDRYADDLFMEYYAADEPEFASQPQPPTGWPQRSVETEPVIAEPAIEPAPLDLNELLDDLVVEPANEPYEYQYVQPDFSRKRGGWGRRERVRPEPAQTEHVAYDDIYDEPVAHAEFDKLVEREPVHVSLYDEPMVEDFLVAPRPIVEEIAAPEPELWQSIPRACRTCRDFRPAESGERGWCTNKWAFSHRRMVDADELPCETSIGGWWLPHDETWMTGVDISAHSQPTPLLDQWLAHRAAENGEYDVATPIRRRQRS